MLSYKSIFQDSYDEIERITAFRNVYIYRMSINLAYYFIVLAVLTQLDYDCLNRNRQYSRTTRTILQALFCFFTTYFLKLNVDMSTSEKQYGFFFLFISMTYPYTYGYLIL